MTEVVEVSVPELPVLDVVFLHGLDGDARATWTCRDSSSFWPAWLAEDLDGVAVWSVGYEAWSSGWRGRAMPMQDRAVNLMAQLQNRGIGQRPLCFVTHSMGGLLAKEILLHAAEGRTEFAVFATNTRGVVFLATPHTGSGLTKFVDALKVVYRATAAVKDLRRSSAHLRQLNDRYRDWVAETGIRNLVFFEAYPTKGVRVVDEVSANPGLPRVLSIPVDSDHINICKPADRDSLVYGQVKRFLTDLLYAVVDDPAPTPKGDVPRSARNLRKLPADTGAFVGRRDDLARLEHATAASERVAVVAVHGLGGIGKSTLAARFAETHVDSYSPVWWVTADSVAAIDHGLADFAVALAPESAELHLEQRTERALGWLSDHTGWLLILDNVTNPTHIAHLLERVRTGTILVTSRQSTGWRGLTTMQLNVLPQEEARELLERIVRSEWPEADMVDGDRLCSELGWLPLAVEQAGAYIAQTRITPSRYLELLAAFPAQIFTATAEGGDAQRTMARVWHVTLDRLADTPLAGSLLRRLAWHAPDHIPRSVLEWPDKQAELSEAVNERPAHAIDVDTIGEPALSEALGRLAAYSMITLDAESISVHRLVQAVTRTPSLADPHRQPDDITRARDTAAVGLAHPLAEADHRLPADWPIFQMVLPHALALLDHTDPGSDTRPHCFLADRLGLYVRNQGDLSLAFTLVTRAAESLERICGSDHPNTLTARNNLAGAYQHMGDLERAIPLYEATLADRERVLGRDDTDTLNSRNNLASSYEAAGDLGRAIPLYQATLADRERVLGRDHSNTLMSQNNLASAYQSAGDLGRAIPLYERTLADWERVVGPDHPHTLTARTNLASAYESAGDLERAIPLHEATLADWERVLGPEHPHTLTSRNNVAFAYESAGDLRRAMALYKRALADSERVLGPDHPNTATALGNMAHAYLTAGVPRRAIPLYERVLAAWEQTSGADHPNTLMARGNLGYAYRLAGDLERAISILEATLAGRRRVLGSRHPDTFVSLSNLAGAYMSAGNPGRAVPMFEAALTDAERALGPDHQITKKIRSNIWWK